MNKTNTSLCSSANSPVEPLTTKPAQAESAAANVRPLLLDLRILLSCLRITFLPIELKLHRFFKSLIFDCHNCGLSIVTVNSFKEKDKPGVFLKCLSCGDTSTIENTKKDAEKSWNKKQRKFKRILYLCFWRTL